MKSIEKKIKYIFEFQLSFNNDYKLTCNGILINSRTGNIIKETVVGYTRGYWIGRKFIAKKRLNDYCEIIERLSLRKLKDLYPNLF